MEDIRIGRRKRTREVKIFPNQTGHIIDNGPNTVHLYFPAAGAGGVSLVPADGYPYNLGLSIQAGIPIGHLDIEEVGDLVTRRLRFIGDFDWATAVPPAYYLYYVTELDEQ